MYHFFVNPSASSGRGKRVWRIVKHILDTDMIPYEVHFLKSAEDAIFLAAQLSEPLGEDVTRKDINHIIVLGGDGSLNTVLQGIDDFSRIRLSVIKTGSGNDFARDMEIDNDPESALMNILFTPEEVLLDYGEMESITEDDKAFRKRFLISSGVGYDANICEKANRSKLKRVLNYLHIGRLVYIILGIKELLNRSYCHATLVMNDTDQGQKLHFHLPNLFFLVSMIHEYEGGGIPFCPNADSSDGKFDICLIEKMSTPKILLAIMLVYQKKHFIFKQIKRFQCKSLTLQLADPLWIHTDGETLHRVKEVRMTCKSGLHFIK